MASLLDIQANKIAKLGNSFAKPKPTAARSQTTGAIDASGQPIYQLIDSLPDGLLPGQRVNPNAQRLSPVSSEIPQGMADVSQWFAGPPSLSDYVDVPGVSVDPFGHPTFNIEGEGGQGGASAIVEGALGYFSDDDPFYDVATQGDVFYGPDGRVYFPGSDIADVSVEEWNNRGKTAEQITAEAVAAEEAAAPEDPGPQFTWDGAGIGIQDPLLAGQPSTQFTGAGGTAITLDLQNQIGQVFTTEGTAAAQELYDMLVQQGFTEGQLGMSPTDVAAQQASPTVEETTTDSGTELDGPSDDAGFEGIESALTTLATGFGDQMTAMQQTSDERMQALTDQFTLMSEQAAAQQQQTMALIMGLMNNRREEDENRGSFTYNALGGY